MTCKDCRDYNKKLVTCQCKASPIRNVLVTPIFGCIYYRRKNGQANDAVPVNMDSDTIGIRAIPGVTVTDLGSTDNPVEQEGVAGDNGSGNVGGSVPDDSVGHSKGEA